MYLGDWEKVNGQNQKATGPLYMKAPTFQVAINRSMRLFNFAKHFWKECYFEIFKSDWENKLFAVKS